MIINKPQSDTLYRVLQARSTDKYRDFLTGLHVETIGEVTYAVATDGKRLHYDMVAVIPDGEYSVPVCKRNQIVLEPADWQFPNWRKVVPDSFSHMVEWSYGKNAYGDDRPGSLFQFYRATECPVNPKFLECLGSGDITVFWTQADKAMAIRQGSFVAIVMPLQMDPPLKVQNGIFKLDLETVTA